DQFTWTFIKESIKGHGLTLSKADGKNTFKITVPTGKNIKQLAEGDDLVTEFEIEDTPGEEQGTEEEQDTEEAPEEEDQGTEEEAEEEAPPKYKVLKRDPYVAYRKGTRIEKDVFLFDLELGDGRV